MRIPPILLLAAAAITLTAATPPQNGAFYLTAGRMVNVGGFDLNIRCTGTGSPTVVFDSGLEDWAPAWITIQPPISRLTRTCTYDRAGNGRSDAGPMPRTTARIVSELHMLLQDAGEKPPYILVGHSFGGINVRHYADRYLSEVAGLVLVDASAEQQVLYMSPKEQRDNDRGVAQAQRFLQRCMRLADNRFRGATRKDVHECPGTFFRGLPDPQDFPGRLDTALFYQAQQPKQYAASASEFTNFTTAGMRTLLREHRSYGNIPLRILVAYKHGHATAKDEALWQMMHRQWLTLSTDAQYIAARRSGHYIQFDQPDLVLRAIKEEIAIARKQRY